MVFDRVSYIDIVLFPWQRQVKFGSYVKFVGEIDEAHVDPRKWLKGKFGRVVAEKGFPTGSLVEVEFNGDKFPFYDPQTAGELV